MFLTLVVFVVSQILPNNEKKKLEFEDGTPCDLKSGAPRSTTVQLSCGAADQLVSVEEDRTCHYTVVATTSNLCRHPAFVRRKPPSRTLACKRRSEQDQPQA